MNLKDAIVPVILIAGFLLLILTFQDVYDDWVYPDHPNEIWGID